MAQKFYFFKTVKIGGRQRLRPLPGQKEPSGRYIDEGLNVQADSRMREDYPLGTIFGSESLELRSLHSTTFYSAGAIYPIGLNLGDYHSQSHMPSAGMNEAYESYKTDIEDLARPVLSGESTLFTESGNAAIPGTLLAQIKADRKMNAPTIEGEGFHIADKDWYLLVRNIKSKVNTMMVGPSGTGKTELVLLACKKLGLECIAMARARAQFSCNFFACAGIRVQDNNFFKSVEEGVEAALASEAQIVVVCASDDDYAEVAPKVQELLGGKAILVVAGAPACTEELQAKGINNFISVKSNVLETLRSYLAQMGI